MSSDCSMRVASKVLTVQSECRLNFFLLMCIYVRHVGLASVAIHEATSDTNSSIGTIIYVMVDCLELILIIATLAATSLGLFVIATTAYVSRNLVRLVYLIALSYTGIIVCRLWALVFFWLHGRTSGRRLYVEQIESCLQLPRFMS